MLELYFTHNFLDSNDKVQGEQGLLCEILDWSETMLLVKILQF